MDGCRDTVKVAPLPLLEVEDDVPPDLKAELELVRDGLLEGSIQTGWNTPEYYGCEFFSIEWGNVGYRSHQAIEY